MTVGMYRYEVQQHSRWIAGFQNLAEARDYAKKRSAGSAVAVKDFSAAEEGKLVALYVDGISKREMKEE